MREVNSTDSGTRIFRQALFFATVFSTAFTLFSVEASAPAYTSELPNHLALAEKLVAPAPFGFAVPHPGFHWLALLVNRGLGVTLSHAGVLVLAVTVTAYAALLFRVVAAGMPTLGVPCSPYALTGALLLVSAIYFPPIDPDFYLGQGSPNFWAVPTLVVVKPFALWSVLLLTELLDEQRDVDKAKYSAVWFAFSLLVGVIMKPSFMIGFAPVAGLLLLFSVEGRGWRVPLFGMAAFAPAVGLLAYQYFTNYHSAQSKILLTWFGVWRLYSNNIPGSMLLAMAFPLGMLVTRFRAVMSNVSLRTSWLFQIVATVQWAFFAEEKYFAAGNFSWGYNLGLTLLFVFSAVELVKWLSTDPSPSRATRLQWYGVIAVFGFHLASGTVHLVRQLNGIIYT